MKKQKTILSSKLKSYSALAGSLLAVSGAAEGQIVYTNITDYTATNNGDAYLLDLNNDTNDDFNFTLGFSTTTASTYFGGSQKNQLRMVRAQQLGSNEMAVDTYNFANVFNLNSNIDATKTWLTYGSGAFMALGVNYVNICPWVGATDKYMGLKLDITGSVHYGWARLDVSANSDAFTIKDYAYELTPNKKILAGDKGTTTSVSQLSDVNSTVYASGNTITIQLSNAGEADITVTNVLGEIIKTMRMTEGRGAIDMLGTASGVYFVTVNANGKTASTKVFIGQ